MTSASKTDEIIAPPLNYARSGRERGRIAMVSTHGYVAAEPPLGMPDTGGQVVFVIELSKKLADLGYVVDIWTRQFEDQPEEEQVAENVKIRRIPCGGHDFIPKEYLYLKLPELISRLVRIARQEKLEYEFINSHYWDAGLVGQALAQELDTLHIHTPHSVGSWKRQKMIEDFPDDAASFDKTYNFTERIRNEKAVFQECDTLVATTPLQIGYFTRDYDIPQDKIVMIPPGYDDSRFYPVSDATRDGIRERFGFQGKKVVASIGRLSRNKGFDLLVDAFSVVAPRIPDAVLYMALGTESEETTEDPMLEEIVARVRELGLQDRVTISSSLPDDAMADFYRAIDVFCLPSRYEPFGMTAIEAMACGTPTVATTNGGLYRTLQYGSDGLFADSFDKEDFGLTVCKILRHRGIRSRLAQRGAHKARSLFTWSGIAQQLLRASESTRSPRLDLAEPA